MDTNNSKLLVIDGGFVKASAEGVVEGLGIVFGSENEPDQSRQRDFFTADSFIQKKHTFIVPLFHDHGMGEYEDQIGEATLVKSDEGWTAKAEIDLSTDAGRAVFEAVKSKKYGFSTGAMDHLVKREPKHNNTNFLKKWVVGEISLTPRPAERRALVQEIKSLDGEITLEDAFEGEETKTSELTLTFVGKDGEKIWESSNPTELPKPEEVKSIDIGDAFGMTSYTLSLYDDVAGSSTDINVTEYGNPLAVLTTLQNIINKASLAMKSQETPEEKDFNSRVASIVETMMKKGENDPKIAELETELSSAKSELVELQEKLDARDSALQFAEQQIENLTILAGAQEILTKHKGK